MLRENAASGASISRMGNVHANVWHRLCGTRNTQTSACYGTWKKSVDRVTQSSAKGEPPGGEYIIGVAMDRRERDEISGVEDTDSGVDTRY